VLSASKLRPVPERGVSLDPQVNPSSPLVIEARARRRGRRIAPSLRLPALFGLTFALMLATSFYNFQFLGFNFYGWAWVLIAVLSVGRIAIHPRQIAFPVWIWSPWILYVAVWTFAGYEYALQSTSQILCPIIAGIAASTYPFPEVRARILDLWIKRAYYACAVGVALIVIPFSLADIDNSGWATGAISLLFFQAWFLASYFLNGRKTLDLVLYFSAVAVPVIGSNRGPMLAGVVLAICAIIPIRLSTRMLALGAAAAIGLVAFYTPKVQYKMFYSGRGTIQDLRLDNPDLQTNGRTPMWSALQLGMADSPLFGHGGNADRTYLLEKGFPSYLPHNDWLRIQFNYGLVGVFLYAGTMLAQVLHALRKLKFAGSPPLKTLTAAALTCFIPYVVVMYTDNVLIYCQYFTVPMMLLLGAAYSAKLPRGTAVRRSLRPFAAPVSALAPAK